MSHRFFLKNLYDFSYSVFNEHSLNFRQGHLAFTKLLRYLNLFKYLRRSVISPKELFSFFLGSSGLEPPTSRLSGARSNQLSYEPLSHTLFRRLRTSFPSVGCLRLQLHLVVDCLSGPPDWRWWDSNPWPPACRAGALPTELHPHLVPWLFLVSMSFSLTENWTTIFVRFVLLSDNLRSVICSSP